MSYNKYFFIGVGGIGMSSIANYLIDTKNIVFGYDRSSNKLVDKLIDNGLKFTDKLDIDPVPQEFLDDNVIVVYTCLLYTSPSPRDATLSRMPSSA